MVKAVYCFEASSMAICQKPDFRSKQEKYTLPKNPSWSWLSACRSQCKSTVLCPSCALTLLNYTWALTQVNGAHFQHLLQMCTDLIHHWRLNPLELLFEGFIVSVPDLILCQVHTTQLPWLKGKDNMIFRQQGSGSCLISLRPPLQAR